jgi:hypothetical protein
MSSEASRPAAAAKSPIFAALGICLVIGLGAVLGSTDMATLADAFSGKWLTQPFRDTQQSHTVAIAALEQGISNISRDLDFVATRVSAAIERGADRTSDRLATLDSEIANLKSKIAALQGARPGVPVATSESGDILGLRTSLHDLTTAHTTAVAALTKRLDRIEVKVGLSSDVTSSVSRPARRARRAAARPRRPAVTRPAFETDAAPATRPERGHLFNVKPLSRQDARLIRLPG